jgi:hypothetical protein
MELTPVKVRGKRTSHRQSNVPKIPSRTSSPRNPSLATITKQSSSQGSPKTKKQRPNRTRKLSAFEALPIEILQTIFVLSENLHLPRSSLPLRNVLTSNYCFLHMSLRALFYPRDGKDKSYILASEILRCRFFTWSFYQRYAEETLALFRRRVRARDRMLYTEEAVNDLLREHNCDNGYSGLIVNLDMDASHFAYVSPPPWLRLETCLVPSRLFSQAWSDDNEKLFWHLGWGGAVMHPVALSNFSSVQQALVVAIEENRYWAIFWIFGSARKWALDILMHEHIRFAVVNCGCNKRIVKFLCIMASSGKCPDYNPLDPILWNWADKAEQSGDDKGTWFKSMISADHGMLPCCKALTLEGDDS